MAKNTKRTEFGDTLVELRKSRHLSQEAVAEKLNIKRDTYARYETETAPPIKIIKKLCEIYNVPSDVILGIDNNNYMTRVHNGISAKTAFSTYIAYNQNSDETVVLSDDEINLIERFRMLSEAKQEALLTFLDD